MKINNILFPTDYSRCSMIAFEYAVRIANHYNASLTILHVYPGGSIMSQNADQIAEHAAIAHDAEKLKMNQFLDDYKIHATSLPIDDLKIDLQLIAGGIVESIIEKGNETNTSMIILGTKGQGESTVNFGSVASSVAHEASVPVIVIPEGAFFKPWKKILYPDDFENTDKNEIDFLTETAVANEAILTILHLRDVQDYEHNYRSLVYDRLKNKYSKFDYVNLKIEAGGGQSKLTRILDYVDENNIDLIATKKRNLESEIEKTLVYNILAAIKIPCIVF